MQNSLYPNIKMWIAMNLFLLVSMYTISGNVDASFYKYTHPVSMNQLYTYKKNAKEDNINKKLKEGEVKIPNEVDQQEISISSKYFNVPEMEVKGQEERLTELERKMKLWEESDQTYRQLLKKLGTLEDQFKDTVQENVNLRKTVEMLQEDLIQLKADSSRRLTPSAATKREEDKMMLDRNRRSISPTEPIASGVNNVLQEEDLPGDGSPSKAQQTMVAFDAYRNKPFHEEQKYVTFDGTKVNVGDAFDPKTGMFVAPVPGVYSFSFHGLAQDGTATYVKLVHKKANEDCSEDCWKTVAGAYRRYEKEGDEENKSPQEVEGSVKKAEGMLAQSVLLELEKNDIVAVYAYHGNLRDGGWHYTHFTGYLLR